MMRHWHKNTIKTRYIFIILLLLMPIMAQAQGVFDRIYKLPNAQTATADNNYQPNVYFLPSTQPTTEASKSLLKHLVASIDNKTIKTNVKQIKQLLLTAVKQNDPVAQGIQATIYYHGWHTPKAPKAAYVLAQKASQQGEGQGDFILSRLIDDKSVSIQQDTSYSLNQIHKNKPKPNVITFQGGRIKDLGITAQAMQGIKLLSSQSKNKGLAKLQRIKQYLDQGVVKNHAQSQFLKGIYIANRNSLYQTLGTQIDNKNTIEIVTKAADQGWPEAINDASAHYSVIRGSIDRPKANHYADQLIKTQDMRYDKAWTMRIKNHYNTKEKETAKALLEKGWALSKQKSASLAALKGIFIGLDGEQDPLKKVEWANVAHQLQNPKIRTNGVCGRARSKVPVGENPTLAR